MQKMLTNNHWRTLDKYEFANDGSFQITIPDHVMAELMVMLDIKRMRNETKEALEYMMAALVDCHKCAPFMGLRVLRFSLNKNRKKPQGVSVSALHRFVHSLKKQGYIHHKSGYSSDETNLAELALVFPDRSLYPILNDIDIVYHGGKGNVHVDGKAMDYNDCRLSDINVLLSRTRIQSGNSIMPYSPYWISYRTDKQFYGRIYSNYNNILSDIRKTMTFDGQETVELDYVSSQMRLQYVINRVQPPMGDMYDVEGYDRDEVKKAAMLLMNPPEHSVKGKSKKIIRLLKQKHKQIKVWDGAISHQLEGAITVEVQHNLAKMNIACVSIHDSFIVQKRYEKELYKQMEEVYYSQTGYIPSIA